MASKMQKKVLVAGDDGCVHSAGVGNTGIIKHILQNGLYAAQLEHHRQGGLTGNGQPAGPDAGKDDDHQPGNGKTDAGKHQLAGNIAGRQLKQLAADLDAGTALPHKKQGIRASAAATAGRESGEESFIMQQSTSQGLKYPLEKYKMLSVKSKAIRWGKSPVGRLRQGPCQKGRKGTELWQLPNSAR